MSIDDTDFCVSPPTSPDYMEFVDPDIRAMFEGKSYFSHEPLLAQLVKELRLQRVVPLSDTEMTQP